MADHYYSSMSSGSVVTHTNWNEMISEIYVPGGISGNMVGTSGNVSTLLTWYNASSENYSIAYASAQLAVYIEDHIASSNAISKFYPSSLGKSLSDFSSNAQAGIINYTAVSSSAISGSWSAPIYRTDKPTASASNEGQIIVASGGTGDKSYVYICLCNDADGYEWIQLAIST